MFLLLLCFSDDGFIISVKSLLAIFNPDVFDRLYTEKKNKSQMIQ